MPNPRCRVCIYLGVACRPLFCLETCRSVGGHLCLSPSGRNQSWQRPKGDVQFVPGHCSHPYQTAVLRLKPKEMGLLTVVLAV